MSFELIIQLTDSTIRLTTPLLLACLAGMYSERSGVFDIGLEGKMLAGAFGAAAVAAVTGSAWIGLMAGMGVSVFFAIIHGFAAITLRANQIISGVAVNVLAAGMSAFIGQNWFKMGGQTPQLSGSGRFNEISLPLAETLSGVPVLGAIYSDLISGHNILTYAAFVAVPLSAWVLFKTRYGLRLRAVGENPGAVDTAGISVERQRFSAVLICGVLCGMAGAYLSLGTSAAGFVRDMTAGKGYIALAALIFAKWTPKGALLACMLFGFLEAIGNKYQSITIFDLFVVPVQFMQALPYILTVVILAGFVGKAVPPKSGGVPYIKER
ncbi:ABC transporter permease [Ruegeria sp. EL01]|jgi:simple sugar transport system permease protein|uniref:ABC transporter permease n=1 Tax=Ruegeria sp. EL01 TaxID=2107578 RepID=UPI000EA80A45|nr:ABC transporter permease [Ruegeria sp. EL01]